LSALHGAIQGTKSSPGSLDPTLLKINQSISSGTLLLQHGVALPSFKEILLRDFVFILFASIFSFLPPDRLLDYYHIVRPLSASGIIDVSSPTIFFSNRVITQQHSFTAPKGSKFVRNHHLRHHYNFFYTSYVGFSRDNVFYLKPSFVGLLRRGFYTSAITLITL